MYPLQTVCCCLELEDNLSGRCRTYTIETLKTHRNCSYLLGSLALSNTIMSMMSYSEGKMTNKFGLWAEIGGWFTERMNSMQYSCRAEVYLWYLSEWTRWFLKYDKPSHRPVAFHHHWVAFERLYAFEMVPFQCICSTYHFPTDLFHF